MKNSYQVRALNTWKALKPYLMGCASIFNYDCAVNKFNRENHRKIKFCYGSTRVCFVTSDYVIKMDYNQDQIIFWGGCQSEYDNYDFACANGCDGAFCPIDKIDEKAYVMPRCEMADWYDESILDEFWKDCNEDEFWYVQENIKDVHNQNVGRYKGRVVLIDYAACV